ncbi:restriction endonuclease subunit S [Flavitalea sp. BT771]|uniref:restriction endonuclease subunit S n=1 Tax=Flavitalea sp. BT771 TaxID=3063329 RepID=UPI0026E320A6|nr:restriction endonuclease subunit S [Flavitalea sp. BT771]MDO6435638.1 restriction endonuclease subunit S [Flavitalea sp. BT771]MDV6224539.1 restriction endonuclease subunit S [Flavitalea sp. BT771]
MSKKGYKQTSLGWIPEDWEVKRIRDIGKISSGTTPARSVSEYHSNGTIHWVKTTDLNNSVIIETEEKVSEKALLETSLRMYPRGTVLVAMYGGFNQIGRTGLLGIEATINQALSAITVDIEKTDRQFLLNWLNANVGLWKSFAGSSRKDPNITSNDVGDFPVIDMPLSEQRQIAAILSTWDAAIAKEKQLIDALQTRHRALMQQLLSGKKRLKGFRGKWRDVRMGELFKEIKDTNDGKGHSVMTISARHGLISQQDKFDRIIAGDSLEKYTLLKKGDFAYNKGNSKLYEMGCVYLLDGVDSAIVPFVYICFRPTNLVESSFYKYWFAAHGLDRQLKRIITSGARGDGLLNVNTDDFFKLNVPFLQREEQSAIAAILNASEKEIQIHSRRLAALKQQRKGLMQVLLTGKVRVI